MAKGPFAEAFDELNEALTEVSKAQLEEVADFAVDLIVTRTRKGIDADGQKFKSYTPKYAKVRARKHLRTDPPDLSVTGHMLGAIQAVPGADEVQLTFNNRHEIDKAVGNTNNGRDFFDVRRDEELEAIAEVIGDGIAAKITR